MEEDGINKILQYTGNKAFPNVDWLAISQMTKIWNNVQVKGHPFCPLQMLSRAKLHHFLCDWLEFITSSSINVQAVLVMFPK